MPSLQNSQARSVTNTTAHSTSEPEAEESVITTTGFKLDTLRKDETDVIEDFLKIEGMSM